MKRTFLILFLISFSPQFISAQTDVEMSAKPAQPDAYAAKALKEWNVSGMTIAIIKDDKNNFLQKLRHARN